MKYFTALVLVGVVGLAVSIGFIPNSYAITLGMSSEKILETQEIVLLGHVDSVKTEEDKTKYSIHVLEYVKSPDEFEKKDNIDAIGCAEGKRGGCTTFENGQEILFVLEQNGVLQVSELSFVAPNPNCTVSDFFSLHDAMYGMETSQGNQTKLFFTGKPIDITFYAHNRQLDASPYSATVEFFKAHNQTVFSKTFEGKFEECIPNVMLNTTFTPMDMGRYGKRYATSYEGGEESWGFSIIDEGAAPLKQNNSGINSNHILCNEGLVLVQKYDNTPACVKLLSISKLIKRGWTETEFDKNKMVELFQDSPEAREFSAVYNGTDISVNEDNVSYFAGSEDGYLARMNMFFDENYALDHIEFNCYFQKTHRFELAQEDMVLKLKKYDCREITEESPEREAMSDVEMQLHDARKSLKKAYQSHVNLGPYYMKDVVVGFGTYDDTLIIDISSKYTDQNSIQTIKKEIRHIVGNQVKIDYAVYDESIERYIETVISYMWNKVLHQSKIDFTPKEGGYLNNADGFAQNDRVCSPLVAPNGTEFFISSTFNLEPFEVTGTFIDKTEPDDCHKIWKTEVIMQEPDRVTALWLENEN